MNLVPQDSTTIDSIDTAVYLQEQNYEASRLAPETAYTAWFRMLGSLGNINQIRSPEQHNRIMKTLFDIWKMLCRVRGEWNASTYSVLAWLDSCTIERYSTRGFVLWWSSFVDLRAMAFRGLWEWDFRSELWKSFRRYKLCQRHIATGNYPHINCYVPWLFLITMFHRLQIFWICFYWPFIRVYCQAMR